MSGNGIKALSICLVGTVSWYAGIKFWKPLIVEQLERDGALRSDIEVPELEKQPKSWEDLKASVRATIHPEVEATKNNQFEQDLKQTVEEINKRRENNDK